LQGDYELIMSSLEKVDDVLGILKPEGGKSGLAVVELKDALQNADIQVLVNEREDARKMKDYARADAIREKLKGRGVVVQDTPDGPVWRVLSTPS